MVLPLTKGMPFSLFRVQGRFWGCETGAVYCRLPSPMPLYAAPFGFGETTKGPAQTAHFRKRGIRVLAVAAARGRRVVALVSRLSVWPRVYNGPLGFVSAAPVSRGRTEEGRR